MDVERFNLAELVESLTLPDAPRDRDLVRQTCLWLHRHAPHLVLEAAASAGLEDVVATLQMRERVDLVVTGHRAGLPGEWTWKVAERDFTDVVLQKRSEPLPAPILFCTLDFAVAGRPVLLPTGDRGTAVAQSLVQGVDHLRVRLLDGEVHTFATADVVFPDELGR